LVHFPHIGLLASVVILILVDQVHEEEEIVGEVVLLLNMDLKSMWYAIQIVFPNPADEAVVPQFILHTLELVSQGAKGINDETLDDGKQDDNDEQEEGDVEEDPDKLIVGTVGWLNDITNTTTGAHTLVQMEDKAGEHVVTLLVWILSLFTLSHIELTEEVEGEDSVDVADNRQQANSEHQLLAIVGDSLEDDPQGRHTDSNVNQMGSKEEVVVVAKDREDEVEEKIEECLERAIIIKNIQFIRDLG